MNKEIDVIEKVSEVLSGPSQNAITHYSQWFFADAASGILHGIILIIVSVFFLFKQYHKRIEFSVLIDLSLMLITTAGIYTVFKYTGTFFAPEGMAIKQFIKDVRG